MRKMYLVSAPGPHAELLKAVDDSRSDRSVSGFNGVTLGGAPGYLQGAGSPSRPSQD